MQVWNAYSGSDLYLVHSALGTLNSTSMDIDFVVSDLTVSALTVMPPSAITVSDSFLPNQASLVFSVDTLSGGSSFVGSLNYDHLMSRWARSLLAGRSAHKPFAVSFSAVSVIVTHVLAHWRVLQGRLVFWCTTGWLAYAAIWLVSGIFMVCSTGSIITGTLEPSSNWWLESKHISTNLGREDGTFWRFVRF